MNSHSAFLILGISWCAALADALHSSNLNEHSARSVRDAGFPGSGRSHGGRRCSPREELEDQLVTATDRQLPRGANGCCRRFGEDYYDRRRDRWRRTHNDDDDRDDSHYSRKRRRFWRRLCRLFKRGGFRPHRAQDDDDEFAPPFSGSGGFQPGFGSGFGGGFQPAGGGGFNSGPGFGQGNPSPGGSPFQVPVQKTSPQQNPVNDDEPDYPDGAAQGQGQAAATGNAKATNGQATSINQANQFGNAFGNMQSAISSNAGQGNDVTLGGAAQGKGAFQGANGFRQGEAAASGNADVKAGQGISINKADQQSGRGGTSSSALNANSGAGQGVNIGGAAISKGAANSFFPGSFWGFQGR